MSRYFIGCSLTRLLQALLGITIALAGLDSCKEKTKPKQATLSPETRHLLDSLYRLGTSITPDSALLVCKQILVIGRQNHDVEVLLRAYCKGGLIYYLQKGDAATGKTWIDSAARLLVKAHRPDLQPTINVYYGLLYQFSDSAIPFLKSALQHEERLSAYDRMMATGCYANVLAINKDYKLARQYFLQFLKENRSRETSGTLSDYVTGLNNLYFVEQGLGDTATAVKYLKQAEQILIDSARVIPYIDFVCENIGLNYLREGNADSAICYFEKLKQITDKDASPMKRLQPLIYLAKAHLTRKEYLKTEQLLHQASLLLPDSGRTRSLETREIYYLHEYYVILSQFYKEQGKAAGALAALEQSNNYNDIIQKQAKNDQVLQYEKQITQAKAEKQLLAQKKNLERQQNISHWLIAALGFSLLLIILGFQYWRSKKRQAVLRLKALEQKTALEKAGLLLQAESNERQRIARELHDELGSTLTSIGLAVQVLKQQSQDELRTPLEILDRNSRILTKQTNEIIWSLNNSNDTLESLVAYIYRHGSQFLKDHNIEFHYHAPTHIPPLELEGYKRRYFFHAVKEVLNNAVKHSKATSISIDLQLPGDKLLLTVKDNGTGLPQHAAMIYGNGIKNIRQNLESLQGKATWSNAAPGTLVTLEMPLYGNRE